MAAPAESFAIRRGTASDAADVSVLADRLFRQAYGSSHAEPHLTTYLAHEFSPAKVHAELQEAGSCVWLAEAGDVPVGYAWLRHGPPPPTVPLAYGAPASLHKMFVDAGWHGRGVAAALFAECLAEARRQGRDGLWLSVWQHADRPIAFYRKAGFSVVGTAEFPIGDRVDQDFIMARSV